MRVRQSWHRRSDVSALPDVLRISRRERAAKDSIKNCTILHAKRSDCMHLLGHRHAIALHLRLDRSRCSFGSYGLLNILPP
jgi:hypothetical protein